MRHMRICCTFVVSLYVYIFIFNGLLDFVNLFISFIYLTCSDNYQKLVLMFYYFVHFINFNLPSLHINYII